MKSIKVILLMIVVALWSSCGQGGDEEPSLSDAKILSYIEACKGLKEAAPGMLQSLNENGETVDAGKAGFADFEKIVKDAGLESYPDFVITNAKIGVIFSSIEANKGMDRSANLESSSNQMIDDAIAFIQTQIDDPNVPEETKEELRKQIKEQEANKDKLSNTYAKNTMIANLVLDKVKSIQGLIVNEADVNLVQKHHSKIFEAYTGFPEPAGMDGKLPKLTFE